MNKLLWNTIFITAGLIIFSNFYGLNIFNEHPIYWLFLIGATLLVITFLCLPFAPLADSLAMTNGGISIIGLAFFIGVIYTIIYGCPPPGYPPLSNLELAKKCDSAEWVISIDYYDDYSSSQSAEFKFIGTTDRSEDYVPKITNRWKQNHPGLRIVSVNKVLIYIPEAYSRIHAFEKEHEKCLIEK